LGGRLSATATGVEAQLSPDARSALIFAPAQVIRESLKSGAVRINCADAMMNSRFLPVLLAALLYSHSGIAAPIISSFSPVYGSSSDTTYIQIFGSGFYPGTLVVKFNGVPASDAAATTADGTFIQARVPASAPLGAGPIFVSVNGVSTFSAADFTVIGAGPYVTSFDPYRGPTGTKVTLDGTHFATGNATNVAFNGKLGVGFSRVSDTRIQVDVPAGATTGPLTILSALGAGYSFVTSSNFFIPPVITGFSPVAGRTGTNVLIRGTNLTGAIAIRFNNLSTSDFTVDSALQITARVPTNATTGPIRVDTPAGSPAITTSNFVVQPTIFGFSPIAGPVGTVVTITGANFNVSGNKTVAFNGVNASSVTVLNFSTMTAVVPPGATTGPITLTTTDGTTTSGANLFYLPARIVSFTPTNSPPGTSVTVTGSNFLGASAVTFNGVPANFVAPTNNTTLFATVPSTVFTGPIAITTPAGTVNSGNLLFYGPPLITSFSPTHGLPGTNVIIFGTNFQGATAVLFNGLAGVNLVVINGRTISVRVPNGAQTGRLTVIGPAGTNTSANNFVLDYSSDLTLTVTDTPDPVFVMSNLTYTITIANAGSFAAPNVAFTNSLPATVLLKSAGATKGSLTTNSSLIVGTLGTIAAGASVIVTVQVTPLAPGTIVNQANVQSDFIDPNPSDNNRTTTTTVLPLPVLAIQADTNNLVRISWPGALTNFALQFSLVVQPPDSWSNVVTPPEVVGGRNVVTETNRGGAMFYRLRQLP
jgi:hypothetical protein